MEEPGPPLEVLLHRLADCPPVFLQVAEKRSESIDVAAIAGDLLRQWMADDTIDVDGKMLAAIGKRTASERKLIAVACWLLADDWFLSKQSLAAAAGRWLGSDELASLARLIRPELFVSDADRREELVRVCLRRLGLRPAGETEAQSADRLNTLDSAERERVLKATAAAERRAREIRAAMAKKKAEEAASRYGE